LSAPTFAGEGYGHPHTQTHLAANLVDADPAATGRGEIAWVSDSKSLLVSINAGVSLPVGSAAYGLADSNAAASAPVTLTVTHIATPANITYTCSLHIAELAFKAPKAPSTTYTERGDFELTASQKNGTPTGPAFGSCASFPAALSAGDTVSVAVGSNTLTGTLK
jgi:hypothetical protein